MLDDLKYIHEKDAADGLGIVGKQAAQLRHKFTFSGKIDFESVHNIVYAGMGGSGLAAQLLKTWPALSKPFEIVRDYDIPAYVDNHTLFIAGSYSGNTEETLSALAAAEAKGAQIAAISSGGKLKELAEQKGHGFAELPKAVQPRYAMLYNFKAIVTVMELAKVLKAESVEPELLDAAQFIEETLPNWSATVPTSRNPLKQLAQELLGKSVVIYGGPKMYPAAYKMKVNVNESAKQVAWVNQIPEFNHTEFIGWSVAPSDKPYAVIDLRSRFEHPRVQKRFEVTARLLSGMRPDPIVVEAQGDTMLKHLLWLVAYGDFLGIYLGILNGIDPSPVALVEKFKQELDK